MSPAPDPHSGIDGDVYVSPRHLAGSLGIGDPALAPLRALGWDLEHDDLGNLYVNSPDHKVRLGFLPEGEDDGLWRINAYKDPFGPPAWGVCFNDSTPTEFVTAFTTALAQAYEQGPDAYLTRPVADSAEHNPFLAVLVNRGWQLDRPEPNTYAVKAPDASPRSTSPSDTSLRKTNSPPARPAGRSGRAPPSTDWYATASTDTPVALLKAVTDCVCDPAPLPRWRKDTHSYVAGMAQLTPILPPSPPAPTPLDVKRAVASRRPATLPAASVPRWSTTTGRPALPGPRR